MADDGITREEAINLIISSIAFEELGLSHIINAEGEKLQYALGTLENGARLAEATTIDEILLVNKSVKSTLENTMKNQMLLGSKLQSALNAPVMKGEKGDKGDMGTILGSYSSLQELKNEHPKGSTGDAYLVNGELYVWSKDNGGDWKSVGNLIGPQGEQGETGAQGPRGLKGEQGETGAQGPQGIRGVAGTVGTIKGSYATIEDLRAEHPTGEEGDFYYINPDLYVWDTVGGDWINVGRIAGPEGVQGIQGIQGETGAAGPKGDTGVILGSYGSYEELKAEHPEGNTGDAFLINGDLYVWKETSIDWENVGSLKGPQGEQGPAGTLDPAQELFAVLAKSNTQQIILNDNLEFKSDSLDITLENKSVRIENTQRVGTIIPFNSGDVFTLSTSISGMPFRRVIIGRGASAIINSLSETLGISGVFDYTILMPASQTITAMSIYFLLTTNTGIVWASETVVTAQLYVSKNPSGNSFNPLENGLISFAIPFTHAVNTTYQFSRQLQISLEPLDRIMLVVSSQTSPSYTLATTIGGRLCASLKIE